MTDPLQHALAAIDSINCQDPEKVNYEGAAIAKALLYGQHMSRCQQQHFPDSSDALIIAIRGQHIERWVIRRDSHEMNRSGYLLWRKALAKHHAQTCHTIMQQQGYQQSQCEYVADLLQKKNLKTNPETQTLEDVACLVFLQHYFEAFAAQHSDTKIIRILQKTWAKMSSQGQAIALQLPLSASSLALVKTALQ